MIFNFRIFLTASALALSVFVTGCSQGDDSMQTRCMDFLYKYMPQEDDLLHDRDFWESNVCKTLEVRSKMGWNVPDREFMHFVLPLRAFNEKVDDFRLLYADTLCRRVAGMSMARAALEVNHWCREQVIYDSSVPHASSPVETVELGGGACIELSEFLVCALRAVGIPARQVNVVWTHFTGNHSWVEAWVDGGWHYMGGCEPSLKLDFAWFRDRATQVMLAPIYVFGDYNGPETIMWKDRGVTAVSNLSRYAPEKTLRIWVKDTQGKPVSGASVSFLVGPDRKKTSFFEAMSGDGGTVDIVTGLGDCAVLASSRSGWGTAKVGFRDKGALITLDMTEKEARLAVEDMVLAPPVASIVPGTPDDWDDWKEEEERRIAGDDSVRVARRHIER